jgi:2-polyprenyl-3-methyl-5-hydroxy-6-metoxy-1,4-benzoquinol methylase
MLPDLLTRVEELELMDQPELPAGELETALRFLGFANRWLGGWSVLREHLEGWRGSWKGPVTLLDVGTGGADLPILALDWARRRGVDLRVTAIDSSTAVLAHARRAAAGRRGLELVRADLLDFAATGRRFDYVCASLVLHHVPQASVVAALKALDALALRGVLVSDLRRCAGGYLGVTVVTAALGDRVTRNDGPLSVRRSFREHELAAAAAQAGLSYLRTRRQPFFRLSLAGQKG